MNGCAYGTGHGVLKGKHDFLQTKGSVRGKKMCFQRFFGIWNICWKTVMLISVYKIMNCDAREWKRNY